MEASSSHPQATTSQPIPRASDSGEGEELQPAALPLLTHWHTLWRRRVTSAQTTNSLEEEHCFFNYFAVSLLFPMKKKKKSPCLPPLDIYPGWDFLTGLFALFTGKMGFQNCGKSS